MPRARCSTIPWLRAGAFVAGVGVSWIIAARPAHACICLEGHAALVAPVGAEHPVGAPLVFVSSCLNGLEYWSATVDGVPVALLGTGEEEVFEEVTLESAAAEGAELVLTHACTESESNDADCMLNDGIRERVTIVIGAPDVAPPPPVDALAISHEIGMFERECGDPEKHYLLLHSTIEIGGREPGAWAVITAEADGAVIASEQRIIDDSSTLEHTLYVLDPDDYAGQEVCVDVQTFDASSNASAVRRQCTDVAASSSGCTITTSPSSWLGMLFFVALAGCRRVTRRAMMLRSSGHGLSDEPG